MPQLWKKYFEMAMAQIDSGVEEANKHHCYGVAQILLNIKAIMHELHQIATENDEEELRG